MYGNAKTGGRFDDNDNAWRENVMKDYIDYMDNIEVDATLGDRVISGEGRRGRRVGKFVRLVPKLIAGCAAVLLIGAIWAIPGVLSNLRDGYEPGSGYVSGEEYASEDGSISDEGYASVGGYLSIHSLQSPSHHHGIPRQQFLDWRVYYGNDDIVGRVWIPDTTIDYLVAQGADNSFYLYHDLQGRRYSPGSIFLDYLADIHTPGDQNWVLFGHNMRANHKFHMVRNFLNYDFFQENRYIFFSTIYADYIFEVFSAYITHVDFPYIWNVYEDWEYWINTFASRSRFDAGIPVSAEDRILTLTTCDGAYRDNRIAVHAVLTHKTFQSLQGDDVIYHRMPSRDEGQGHIWVREQPRERHIVIFDPMGGTFPDTEKSEGVRFVSAGQELTDFPPEPVREGYIFDGWLMTNGASLGLENLADDDYITVYGKLTVHDDMLLTAIWITCDAATIDDEATPIDEAIPAGETTPADNIVGLARNSEFIIPVTDGDFGLYIPASIRALVSDIPIADGDLVFYIPSIAPGEVILLGTLDFEAGDTYQAILFAAEGIGSFMGVTDSPDVTSASSNLCVTGRRWWRPLISGSGSRIQVTHHGNGYHYLYVGSTAAPDDYVPNIDLADVIVILRLGER